MKRVIALIVLMAITFGGGVVLASSVNGDFEGFPIIKMMVDGKEVTGDVPAINFKGRTMVPVRFVAEALGAKVTWNAATLTASIASKQLETAPTTSAGNGFSYSNVSISKSLSMVKMIGEMENTSGNNYSMVVFTVSLYTADGSLVGSGSAIMQNINNGDKKTFDTFIDADYSKVSTYKIQFESGF